LKTVKPVCQTIHLISEIGPFSIDTKLEKFMLVPSI
jgi:hypothetical protein